LPEVRERDVGGQFFWNQLDQPLFQGTEARGEAAHRPGYLSPRLARNLRVVTSEKCNIGRAALEFEADCRAAGIKGAVWLQYAGSCG
jgi:hypothetical protein